MNNMLDPRKTNSFKFGYDLAMELVTPYMKERLNWRGIQSKLAKTIREYIPEDAGNQLRQDVELNPRMFPYEAKNQTRKRCTICTDDILGSGYRGKKNSATKYSTICQMCSNTTCADHLYSACSRCTEKLMFKPNTENTDYA